jgi:hypothetical protein
MYVVFPSPRVNPQVEEFSIGIPFLDVSNTGTLFLSSPLNHRQGHDLSFQTCTKINLISGQQSIFLGKIKLEDDKQGGVQQNFSIGEYATAPLGQALGCITQFVE